MNDRRIKRFLVSTADLVALLKGTGTVVDRQFPADATILYGQWEPNYGSFSVFVHSAEFPVVEAIHSIPFTDNGPIVAEIKQ